MDRRRERAAAHAVDQQPYPWRRLELCGCGAAGRVTLQIMDGPARQGSVGLPAPQTILEVVDLETGTEVLPMGEKGEICFPRAAGDEGLLEEAGKPFAAAAFILSASSTRTASSPWSTGRRT